jgi:hypothetical protein
MLLPVGNYHRAMVLKPGFLDKEEQFIANRSFEIMYMGVPLNNPAKLSGRTNTKPPG